MKKPVILAIDDDTQVLQAITRDLRSHYRNEYRIMSADNAAEALDTLKELKRKQETVAMFVSDQRMPDMLGVDFLGHARKYFPDAKRILLTAYSDTEAAIRAINDVQLDYYLMKPWDPPEEKVYPALDDQLGEWLARYKPPFTGIKVIGYQFSQNSHVIKDFLAGNLVPYQWLDVETNAHAKEVLELNDCEDHKLPVVVFEDGTALSNPALSAIAQKLGKDVHARDTFYDVVIIGAGPAGLAAGVYGGSEGLKTLLIEKRAPGGQAGTSSRIENYLGFPAGLSGADLTHRAITQARRFGIEFLSPAEVVGISVQDEYKILKMDDGAEIKAQALVITTGVDYRHLDAKGLSEFTGAGVYYGAATTEAVACKERDVYIVGGGNSAGQAAMYLSRFARSVHIVIRREDLTSSMSHYLIQQIEDTPNVFLVPYCEVVEGMGNGKLEKLKLKDCNTEEVKEVEASALFIFIGAKPYTDWINLDVMKDKRGFLETGSDLEKNKEFKKRWKKARKPYLLETSVPGIFAAGDVRSGAMNRIASAVGEGAMAIKFVHEYLAE